MGKYNFDEIIPRKGTGCIKYDAPDRCPDNMQLWIADMDFKTPDFVLDALRARLDHPVLGYPSTPASYTETISGWLRQLHGIDVPAELIRFIPGIVRGFAFALDALCKPGDQVIIQPPVYHPFKIVPEAKGYEVVFNPLTPIYDAEGHLTRYKMDLEHLESIISPRTKALILSNPHNPCGIAWTREELAALAQLTSRHGIIVLSDEIHCEMLLDGRKHIPYAFSCPEAAQNSITFMAPSKTFNIAGIVSSYCFCLSEELRDKFYAYLEASEIDYPPIFSVIACQAAYQHGTEWRAQMLEYVQGNVDFVDSWLKANLPEVHCVRPEASFLIWLDCRALGLNQKDLVSLFEDKACLSLNDGAMFGPGGEGFMRLNIGCPRSMLQEALERLSHAVNG